jgi:hypothetical protein
VQDAGAAEAGTAPRDGSSEPEGDDGSESKGDAAVVREARQWWLEKLRAKAGTRRGGG